MTEQHSKRRAAAKASPARSGRGASTAARRGPKAKKKKLPADPKALAQGVFAHVDPEGIAVGVLKGDDERLKLRVWELLLAYAYGKPAQYVEATGPEGGPIRMVWDIPAPERERAEEDKS